MQLRFGLQVRKVDVATVVVLDGDDGVASHGSRCGVRAVGRQRDEADVAVALTTRGVVTLNGQQSSVLTIGTRLREGMKIKSANKQTNK